MNRRIAMSLAAFGLILATTTNAPAAESVVKYIPADAFGAVIINNMTDANAKAQKVAQLVGAPLPDALLMFKSAAGIETGMDEKGSLALVAMPLKNAEEGNGKNALRPIPPPDQDAVPLDEDFEEFDEDWPFSDPSDLMYPLALVAVSDYKKFISQFGADDASGNIVEVPVAGKPVLICKRGSFAVFVEPKHREELKKILAAPAKASDELAKLETWIAANDVSTIITKAGVNRLVEEADKGLDQAQRQFEDFGDDSPEIEQLRQMMKMYQTVIRFFGEELEAGGMGIRVSNAADVHLVGKALVRGGGDLAKVAAELKPAADDPLAVLPSGDFVFALAGSWSEAAYQPLLKLSAATFRLNPALYGLEKLSDEDAKKLAETSMQALKGLKWMSEAMYPGKGNDPLFSDIVGAMRVDNSAKYIDGYAKSLADWNELAKKMESAENFQWEVEKTEIAGGKGLKISVDLAAVAGAQAGGIVPLQPIMDLMFGNNGKMVMYLAAADDTTVFMAYTSKDRIAKAIEDYRKQATGLGKDAEVAKTTAMLLPGAQWKGYVSPSGTIVWANRAIDAFSNMFGGGPGQFRLPAFPASSPIGGAVKVAGDGMETDMVLPATFLKEIPGYVELLGNAFGGGF